MRFLALLLLVLMLPVHVLAASHVRTSPGITVQAATVALSAVPHAHLVEAECAGQQVLPDPAGEPQRTVAQGDLDEVPIPVVATTRQMTRAVLIRPRIVSFAWYAVPEDVFRPPRAV